ncbi:LLM class flavin-dependent oxidoreductase [Pseudonocardia sp. TRM90224]|uniref:LLM class flavin-dependent oxidoreductase n=1 Tax=Pseudonocardia sp. TRM90224 TaxID=2812678 RepID=UPI001E38E6FE|nr:LLM class flavin-dependent oxidoreductase [Pseudonocardia sp. TRM90224]
MNSALRFGVFLPAAQFAGMTSTEVLDATVATAVAAEQAGFDEVWVAEHHFQSYGLCPSAMTMAAHLLGVTERVAVGTAVTVMTTQHPVAVAEQALLLDQLSHGRFRLGVGRGGPWIDLQVFGAPAGAFEAGMAESLDLLLDALAGPTVTGHGPRYPFPTVPVVPRPQNGCAPQVLLAATSAATVDLAAARGLPLLLGMHADDTEKARAIARHGTARCDHIGVGVAYVADTDAEAESTLRAALPGWLGPGLASYRRADGHPHRTRDPHEYTEHLIRIHPVGSPARCRERLTATLRATGLERMAFLVEGTGDPARTLDNVRRFGAEVLAPLRGTGSALLMPR